MRVQSSGDSHESGAGRRKWRERRRRWGIAEADPPQRTAKNQARPSRGLPPTVLLACYGVLSNSSSCLLPEVSAGNFEGGPASSPPSLSRSAPVDGAVERDESAISESPQEPEAAIAGQPKAVAPVTATMTMPTDACHPNPCSHDAVCTLVQSGPRCDCTATGHTGPLCQHELDPCGEDHGGCDPRASCLVSAGERTCVCPVDLAGDGVGPEGCRRHIIDIAVQRSRALALDEAGYVYIWGADPSEGATRFASPTRVPGLDNVGALGQGGDSHVCAVLRDGRARCWGDNSRGALGDGTTVSSATPVSVTGLENVTRIAHSLQTCAVAEGKVYCWGPPYDAAKPDALVPTLVEGIEGAVDVSLGSEETCALLRDGSVFCWGFNEHGQIGTPGTDGTTSSLVARPTRVSVVDGATAIVVGPRNGPCATTKDTIKCWGSWTDSSPTGVRALDLADSGAYGLSVGWAILATSGGGVTFANFACAARMDATVGCWMQNEAGSATLLPSYEFDTVKTSCAGANVCVLLKDSRVYCWGSNGYGQLGDGTTADSVAPVLVRGL